MIRLSRLFTFGVKFSRVKDLGSTICSGSFAFSEPCYGQITNRRQYAIGPQGIILIFCILHLFYYKSVEYLTNGKVLG
jgi:hypothetical protein